MKKIKPKIYAQALYVACKESTDQDLVLKNFAKVLFEHNQLSKINEIIKEFKKIYNKNENLVEVEIETVFALKDEEKESIKSLIKKIKSVKDVVINEKISKNNIGGVKISFDDIIIDGTIKRKLQIINNNFNK